MKDCRLSEIKQACVSSNCNCKKCEFGLSNCKELFVNSRLPAEWTFENETDCSKCENMCTVFDSFENTQHQWCRVYHSFCENCKDKCAMFVEVTK